MYDAAPLSTSISLTQSRYTYLETQNIAKNDLSHAQQLAISATCGIGAGVLSSLASQPGDTILSRINSAAKAGASSCAPRYTRVLMAALGQSRRSVTSVYKELGFRGLWLGTGARCVFTGTLHSYFSSPSKHRSSHAHRPPVGGHFPDIRRHQGGVRPSHHEWHPQVKGEEVSSVHASFSFRKYHLYITKERCVSTETPLAECTPGSYLLEYPAGSSSKP